MQEETKEEKTDRKNGCPGQNNHREKMNTKKYYKYKKCKKNRRRRNNWKYMTCLDRTITESRLIENAKSAKEETKIQTMEHKSRIL